MTRRSPLAFLLALTLGLLLRTAVPAGWMPASGGWFAIEPCPAAQGPLIIQVAAGHEHRGMHHRPGHAAQHSGDCAFAPLASAMAWADVPPAPPDLVPPAHASYAEPGLKPFATGPPAPPPPATGPPALA